MMGYGYYGDMMGGFGWVWMLLVLAAIVALVVWGTRTALWSRDRAPELNSLELLRRRYAAGEITAPECEQVARPNVIRTRVRDVGSAGRHRSIGIERRIPDRDTRPVGGKVRQAD